jgi:dihydroflavonol-4-reductase
MFVAVTGASGHLGNNVVRALLEHNCTVRALVHQNTQGINNLPVERVMADVLDLPSLQSAFDGVDTVIHLAGRISITSFDRQKVEAINITGVKNMIAACLSADVKRVVHVSSIHAHKQEPLYQELNETRALVDQSCTTIYDNSKAQGELIVRQAIQNGLNAIIINPTGIIGPYDFEPSHFGAALLAFAQGNVPLGIGGGFNWVDARDVAEGILRAAKSAPSGEKYLLSGHWVAMRDMASYVCSIVGNKSPLIVFPLWSAACIAPLMTVFDRVARRRPLFTSAAVRALNSNRVISHAKASWDFGYQPRPIIETLTDTLTWFRENGLLKTKKVTHASR